MFSDPAFVFSLLSLFSLIGIWVYLVIQKKLTDQLQQTIYFAGLTASLIGIYRIFVNAGDLGGLFIIEGSCDKKDFNTVENLINKTIDEISYDKISTLDEIKKAINIVKSNYVFNLETPTQLTSFFGNELLWGRRNLIDDLDNHLSYWNSLINFKEIINYLSREKYTLIVSKDK